MRPDVRRHRPLDTPARRHLPRESHSMDVLPSDPQKKGVLFISSAEQPGADTFIHMLIMRSLDRARFDVHVACSAGTPDARTPGYRALASIPNLHLREANFGPSLSDRSVAGRVRGLVGAWSTIASFGALARYIRAHDIRVLHSTDRPRDAVACAVLGRLTGATSIIHAPLKCADWMGRPLRWAMGRVDAPIGVSAFVVGSLVEHGYDSNARRVERHRPRREPDWTVRRAPGVWDSARCLVGRRAHVKGKGQDDVVRALPAVCHEFPGVRLLIIGRDDRQVMRTSFTAELKALAADLGVSSHVIFTGQRSDMPALMAACDVFALPSQEEPFGLVFVEAMAMKKPVVALNNGGAPEVVDHGKSGLLSAPDDVDALAANLLTLLRDPALRARMGEFGRTQAETRFSAQRLAEDVARVYSAPTAPARVNRVALAGRPA